MAVSGGHVQCINFWYNLLRSWLCQIRDYVIQEDLLFAVDNNPQGEEGRHLLSEVVEVIK